jgi:hypothetical protein
VQQARGRTVGRLSTQDHHHGNHSGAANATLGGVPCRCARAAQVFRHMTSLKVLDMSDTDVTEAGVAWLGGCRQLTWLSLCNTEVGDPAAASLAGLVSVCGRRGAGVHV